MPGFTQNFRAGRLYRECRRETRRHAKSFYFASHVLPREKRRAAFAVYAFCRHADNIVDTADLPRAGTVAREGIRSLHAELGYLYSFSPLMNPKLRALQETVVRFHVPREYFQDLLRGVEMDLSRSRYETFEDLQKYCYRVASAVGLIMAHILGATGVKALRHAADLGTAMQLTNILRDIREDYAMGRVYLPADEMREFGVTDEDLRLGRVTPAFRQLLSFQIARARLYYASGEEGFSAIPNDGSRYCVKLMAGTYSGILGAIESMSYDVFSGRAHVPLPGKLSIALRQVVHPSADATRHSPANAGPAAASGFTATGEGPVVPAGAAPAMSTGGILTTPVGPARSPVADGSGPGVETMPAGVVHSTSPMPAPGDRSDRSDAAAGREGEVLQKGGGSPSLTMEGLAWTR
jgi:phytoene synthase